jgi:hypothetical protein
VCEMPLVSFHPWVSRLRDQRGQRRVTSEGQGYWGEVHIQSRGRRVLRKGIKLSVRRLELSILLRGWIIRVGWGKSHRRLETFERIEIAWLWTWILHFLGSWSIHTSICTWSFTSRFGITPYSSQSFS